jgi:hypothetical protein
VDHPQPMCKICQWESAGQCEREWPDRTFSDSLVYRRITIKASAHETEPPAFHVWKFWCHGDKYTPIGMTRKK